MEEQKQQILTDSRLMARWVTSLANTLQYHKFLTQAEAFRQAHLTKRLLVALGEGEAVFTYKKDNGFLRRARGTLCRGISEVYDRWQPADKKPQRESETNTSFTYFDLDIEAFRSFKAENLIDIKVLGKPSGEAER